jgi:hypothetical protein
MKILSKKIKLTGRIKYTKENHRILWYIKGQFDPEYKIQIQNSVYILISGHTHQYGSRFSLYNWEEEQGAEIWTFSFKHLIK